MQSRSVHLSRISVALLFAVRVCISAENAAPHIHNFAQVNDHLYRGAVPSPVGLEELGAMGIKTVIDLRESGEGTQFEKEQVEKLKMNYVNVPLKPLSAPTQPQMERLLGLLLENGPNRIFVHCRRGKDRTGTVIACYRIQHDGWDNHAALAEAQKLGLSFTERGMHSYILHFSPVVIPTVVKAGN